MSRASGVVFMFAGQGCQWEGMAVELIDRSPLFASQMQKCEQALAPHVNWSLLDVLHRRPRARKLQRVDVVAPALFAVAVSLAELWRACGVQPDAVVGHSHGEIAAAYVAGGLSLEDAARVAALRGRALSKLSQKGGVVAVALGAEHVTTVLGRWQGRLTLAAVNGPASTAVSGDRKALAELVKWCKAEGIRAGRVPMDYASHSPQVDAIRDELLDALAPIGAQAGEIPFYSTLTGQREDTTKLDGEHWYRAERETVRFEPAIRVLLQQGYATFIEVSPHPVLTAAAQETVDLAATAACRPSVVGSLRRDQGGPQRFLTALEEVSALGVQVDWQAADECVGVRATPALQAEREWMMLDEVRAQATIVLGIDSPAALDPQRAFSELGLDSSGAVELRNRLARLTGLTLAATLLFDYPTPAALASDLSRQLAGSVQTQPAQVAHAPAPSLGGARTGGTEPAHKEPLAIVGISCRYPGGVRSAQDLWELVACAEEAIGGFPADRGWDPDALADPDPARPGTSYVREGGFLYDAGDFDASFFAISPREALAMDPQQRLLLEVCWEAFEHAGIPPTLLRGSRTGVFTGLTAQEYGTRLHEAGAELAGYALTGTSASVASGRIAYALGLEGPAVSVDTACSSSLVALHLAGQALRAGECSLALAGGVTVMAGPGMFVEFSRQQGLARDGRCKPFADAADGTAWSEGVGMLVLERLADAQRNGHQVLALVRGSAVNQDGASNGLTAPSRLSQQRLIAQALIDAGLAGDAVDAVEAHGTGTTLGDPIEAQALLATYGQRPQSAPLWLGSLKSNIGHTQAAAGVAGVIKMVMALRHELLPATLHIDKPSSAVDWSSGAVSLLSTQRPWRRGARIRRAGVSSFGISGTNAHVIIEEPPREQTSPTAAAGRGAPSAKAELSESPPAATLPWVVSGRGTAALRAQAQRLRAHVAAAGDLRALDIGLSLVTTRSALTDRAVVLGADREQLLTALDALVRGEPTAGIVTGTAGASGERLALLFTGQGAQRLGMGRALYSKFAVFRAAFDEVCGHLDVALGCALREVVLGERESDDAQPVDALAERARQRQQPGGELLDQTQFTQCGLFALEVALFRLVESYGVKPDYVAGHSIGELVAAHVAGVFSLEDACRLVAARGALMAALPSGGAMVSVQASEAEILPTLAGLEERVALAAVNGPRAVVLSGDEDAVLEQAQMWQARGRKTRQLQVSHAFHSPRMEPMLARFAEVASSVRFCEPRIPVVSNVTGAGISAREVCDPGYWVRHVRATVHFADGVRWLYGRGVRSFLELGPEGVLSAICRECLADLADPGEPPVAATAVLRREWREEDSLLTALSEIWVRGAQVDWSRLFAGADAKCVALPTYAFQREHFWLAQQARGIPAQTQDSVSEARGGGKRYAVRWQHVADAQSASLRGRWLVLVPTGAAAERPAVEIAAALERHGARVLTITVDLASVERKALAEQVRGALDGQQPSGVLSLLALDDGEHAQLSGVPRGLTATLALAQALADGDVDAPLWTATTGAVRANPADRLDSPLQAMVWGLGRVVALEDPGRWGGLVDLPADLDERSLERLCGVLAASGDEDQVAVRSAGTLVRRLVHWPLGAQRAEQQQQQWQPQGTVLLTGGTGALGGHLARWLARGGAEHIVLASRRGGAAPGAKELESELQDLGARVTLAACDVADRAQLAALLAAIPAEYPLSAVFHAAGVLEEQAIVALTPAQLRDALAAKASAALHLHELTAQLELSAFVLCSSIASTLGSGGQGGYAAANAFLDALTEHRRARGLVATSIAWGAWAGEGMAAASRERLRRQGVRELSVEPALAALEQALDRDTGCSVIADFEWEVYAPLFASARSRPLLAELPEVQGALADQDERSAELTPLARTLAELAAADQPAAVLELVRTQAAAVLGHTTVARVGERQPFKELGFDSLAGVQLCSRLATASGLRLPSTLTFDYPTPTALAQYLLGELTGARRATSVPTATATAIATADPVAIVGMGCRYPGSVRSPDELWRLLVAGGDAIAGFPVDRGWNLDELYDPDPDHPGTSYANEGGFLDDAGEFDASFFAIGPREALAMDPQQRLLLETCWEALEDAGIDPLTLQGSPAGVFAGISGQDYSASLRSTPADLEGYGVTGGAASVVSGRVAYALGLEGPALTVDTACSASLVALHLACGALRGGECSLALAGGVTVMATPDAFIEFARQRGLAPDGRCKPFADAADGTGWSEGVGVLVLERLSDAQRNGHQVLALVSASAVNQDGASNGLTAPNGPSQQRVIRQALANAGLAPTDVDAIEAHGTGTTLGDPIEAQALLATYGQRPQSAPLWLGSLKSNIGHTQAAAGVAGVIKMVMALRHELLPRTLHVDRPSGAVDWSAGVVSLLTEQIPWTVNGKPRRAGVSSFGISGTNAHVILEEAPRCAPAAASAAKTSGADGMDTNPATTASDDSLAAVPWVLSAKTDLALGDQAGRLLARVEDDRELAIKDVGLSLAHRSVFEHRAIVLGESRADLVEQLRGLAAREREPSALSVVHGVADTSPTAFMFTGQGAQRAGMGRELYAAFPVFRAAFDAACAEFDGLLGCSLRDVVFAERGADRLDQTLFTQAGLFALGVALFWLLEALEVHPDFLIGHSIGELTAAHVAGVFSLHDACALVAARGRLMGALPAGGAMVSIQGSESEVLETLAGLAQHVSLAAVNGPASVVISGDEHCVLGIAELWRRRGRKTKRLQVSHAFHSPRMDAMLEDFRRVAESIDYRTPGIAIVANATGALLTPEQACAPDYWVRHVREPVRFLDGARRLAAAHVARFVELGPDGTLSALMHTALEDEHAIEAQPLLRAGLPEPQTLLRALGEMWVRGVSVDWTAVFTGSAAKCVSLPTYAFQRKRYWPQAQTASGDATALGLSATGHPLLGGAVPLAGGEQWIFTGRISLDSHPWLADHVVMGVVLLPGTAFVELALHAGQHVNCEHLDELTLEAPLAIPDHTTVQLQVTLAATDEHGRRSITVHSRTDTAADADGEPEWTRHATGALTTGPDSQADSTPALLDGPWPPTGADAIALDGLYARLAEQGLEYGDAFRGLIGAWQRGEDIFAEVELPADHSAQAAQFGLHPALLDAVLHAGLSTSREIEHGQPRLPFSWNGCSLHAHGSRLLRARLSPVGRDAVSVVVSDQTGTPVATVAALSTRPVSAQQLQGTRATDALFTLDWITLPLDADATTPDVVMAYCPHDASGEVISASQRAASWALGLVQDWLADERVAGSRLVMVTRGALAIAGEAVSALASAPVWGLVRSAQTEHPGRFLLVDLDDEQASQEALADAVATAIAADEPQIALRRGEAFVARLARAGSERALAIPAEDSAWRLAAGDETLEELALVPAPESHRPLGPGEVRIGVRAAGVNFRDVLVALGMYPGAATIGAEGAGVVLETGSDTEGFAPGDRVLGLLTNAFGPIAITDHRLIAQVPDGWSFAQAASVPIVFLTAYYALVDLAELQAGEQLLVHAAAGGVGMAAVQLASHLGAEVFATASPGKWRVLESLGLSKERIASSRELDFKEQFLHATAGHGVDVVLNALAGEFVDASLELLPDGGRFLEMGKTDIRTPAHIAEAHQGVAYRAFDLMEAGPERIRAMLRELLALFQGGVLEPLPVRAWDIRLAVRAFRYVSQARHVGKNVLTLPPPSIGPEGTVLITGGTGGLGGLLAGHLVKDHGVRRLLLVSRRGTQAPDVDDLVAGLSALGAEVTVAACDVADRSQVQELLAGVSADHPLSAVIHTAGVLDDGVIGSLADARLERVLAPKVNGAWHLHELTSHIDLQAFVLYSSVAGTFGGAGQGNYAAGNAFLDALAAYRSAQGLPASSLAWGPWAQERGMTSGLDANDLARIARGGMLAISSEQGLELFDTAYAASRALTLPTRLDAAALRAQARTGELPKLLHGLIRRPFQRGRAAARGSLAQRLAGVPAAEHERVVLELVRTQAAGVLGHASPELLHVTRAFKDLGFDSLAAVELRNRLQGTTGLRLASTVMFDYPTPVDLARYLLDKTKDASTAPIAAPLPVSGVVDEPIAIVGMSCRLPGGVRSPGELWELVSSGRDAIGVFPANRGWDLEALYDPTRARVGTTYVREGGFLDDADAFDPEFFEIAPREALAMDPQQRQLLEACWEAVEHAGIAHASLRGSPTGVFAGVSATGYGAGLGATGSGSLAGDLEGYGLTGGAASVASGRVAYALGLEGPALSVDTACSSSLVALHLACGALRRGECSLALAGGVAVMADPGIFIEFARQRGLAPDGRCKSFAAAADGTGWSEGVGVLVLERLSDARRNAHQVLALVSGSAVNQDGASNGLTAPNGLSQQRAIRQALASAGLRPDQVDAVEAHGTGTTLGDPIEAQALLATYGQERERPLWLGSLKSNIGHTQAAAGVAGVIKMVMALHRGALPATLHVDRPSAEVDWSAGAVSLLSSEIPWRRNGEPRRAGVSSFGISGTNAHVILEEAPLAHDSHTAERPSTAPALPVIPLLVSAKTDNALIAQAQRLHAHLQADHALEPLDVACSLASRRSQFERRAVVLGTDRDALLDGLQVLARDTPTAGVRRGAIKAGGTAFMFTGQGAQWPGMGSELCAAFPVFAAALAQACNELDRHLGRPLLELVFATEGSPEAILLDDTQFTQAALFALEVALYRLLESLGVRPDYLIGHSIGELVAAHVAGVFSLADACVLVAARGRLMGALPVGGAMLAVQADEHEVGAALHGLDGHVAIAAVNAPNAVVLSGDAEAIAHLRDHWQQRERRTRLLNVSHAFHSEHMAPMLEQFREVAEGIGYERARIPIIANVSGELADADLLNANYWVRQVSAPVRFADGIATLEHAGVTRFLELGPDGVLAAMARECLNAEVEAQALIAPTLRTRRDACETLIASLAEAHIHGVEVEWAQLFAERGAQPVELPTYAFQRERYWLAPPRATGELHAAGLGATDHPMLSAAVQVAGRDEWLFTGRLSLDSHPWLGDHAVFDTVLLPAATFVELALAAGARVGCEMIEELTFEAPLVLAVEHTVVVQLTIAAADESGRRAIAIHARPEDAAGTGAGTGGGAAWTRHASGMLTCLADSAPGERLATDRWPPHGAESLDTAALYPRLAELGFGYGPAFQGTVAAWRRDTEIFAEVTLEDAQSAEAASFALHPALLDAAGHAALERFGEGLPAEGLPLPFCWSGVRLYQRGVSSLRVRIRPAGEDAIGIDAFDGTGALVLSGESLLLRTVAQSKLTGTHSRAPESLFGLEWAELQLPSPNGQVDRFAVLGDLDVTGIDAAHYVDLPALHEALGDDAVARPDLVLVAAPSGACSGGLAAAVPDHDLARAVHDGVQATLELLQAWLADDRLRDAQLVIVTRKAVAIHAAELPELAIAPVWGLVGSAQAEHPSRVLLVDIDDGEVPWRALRKAGETQLALREGTAYAPRLGAPGRDTLLPPMGEHAWHLAGGSSGTLEDLALVANPDVKRQLGPHEVRVAVRAAGLNFRDVLIALGQYPGNAPIGGEAAGVVLEVGSDVGDLTRSDRVMGMVNHAFGPVAVSDRDRLVAMPQGWSFVQAAAVPVAFLTAYYALIDLGQLTRGEALLVHAGAGGVGMAAVQIAQHIGAEVYATASPWKWDALRELGLDEDHIASSRDLDFRERFLAATDNRGVDVVLDALTGEFVDASLDLLVRGGRFIEMGKADIRDPEQVIAEHGGVRYRAFDLAEVEPQRLQQMLVEISGWFACGALHAMPVRTWDVRRGAEAFRYLREGRNVGKVVLTVPQPPDPAGTVLITGGTGGLGALVARHLTRRHGIRQLLLLSRRGPEHPGAQALVQELASFGAEARVVACDVADRDALANALATIAAEHPLTAVIHAAGVLDDGVIEALTADQVARVMRPKVDACVHLHELTEGMELAAFVSFSSVAALLGTPGQGNYAAANAFLAAFTQHRRARGLTGQALAWGLWAEAGMSAALSELDRARLTRLGTAPLTNEQGLELFDAASEIDDALLVALRLEQAELRAQALHGTLPALLRGLLRTSPRRMTQTGTLLARLGGMSDAESAAAVLELVRSHIAAVLGLAAGQSVERERPFKELGLDSLAALELRNRLASATGLRLPATLVFDHPSAVAVAEYLRGQLQGNTDVDGEQASVRQAIASIPLTRLRSVGLLDVLLELADAPDHRHSDALVDSDEDERTAEIDTMSVSDLVRHALATSEPGVTS